MLFHLSASRRNVMKYLPEFFGLPGEGEAKSRRKPAVLQVVAKTVPVLTQTGKSTFEVSETYGRYELLTKMTVGATPKGSQVEVEYLIRRDKLTGRLGRAPFLAELARKRRPQLRRWFNELDAYVAKQTAPRTARTL